MLPLENLRTLLANQVGGLHDASTQWSRMLPRWARRASHQALTLAFWDQHAQTKGQIARLEWTAEALGLDARTTGSVNLGAWMVEADRMHVAGTLLVIDAALIASARQVGYWLAASYGSAKSVASLLELDGTVASLDDSLAEVVFANRTLEGIAVGRVLPAARLAELMDHEVVM
jgi:ferritin-like metal-binding protein YciE